jgi:RNA polymerase sigma-70 factor (ECF subfamily)
MIEGRHKREAFEAMIRPHLPALMRLARRLAREVEDADDLVQETCLKAYRALHQFQPGSDSKAWLVTILMNTYRDWARKTLKHPRPVDFDDIANFYTQLRLEESEPREANPETAAVNADLGRLVRMAIDDLQPEFRMAILLADVEGYTYKEIAEIMGCPIGTVMSRLYRGRQLLQSTLRAYIEHES